MLRIAPTPDDVDALMLLDRLQFALLGYADVLDLSYEEMRQVEQDCVALRALVRDPLAPDPRDARRAIRARIGRLLARVRQHPAYTPAIGRDLAIEPPSLLPPGVEVVFRAGAREPSRAD